MFAHKGDGPAEPGARVGPWEHKVRVKGKQREKLSDAQKWTRNVPFRRIKDFNLHLYEIICVNQ